MRVLGKGCCGLLWAVGLAGCASPASTSTPASHGCVPLDASLDCSQMCKDYCAKLHECNVNASATCVDDCQTVTQAGANVESYQCVITKPCANISNCGI